MVLALLEVLMVLVWPRMLWAPLVRRAHGSGGPMDPAGPNRLGHTQKLHPGDPTEKTHFLLEILLEFDQNHVRMGRPPRGPIFGSLLTKVN